MPPHPQRILPPAAFNEGCRRTPPPPWQGPVPHEEGRARLCQRLEESTKRGNEEGKVGQRCRINQA